MQTFYHGLNTSTRETMDAAAGGAFLFVTSSVLPRQQVTKQFLSIMFMYYFMLSFV
jgi:hypothetical protein